MASYTKRDGSISLEEVQKDIERLNALLYERTTSMAAERPGEERVVKKQTPPVSSIHFDLKGRQSKVIRQQAPTFGGEETPRYIPPRPTEEDRRNYPYQEHYEDAYTERLQLDVSY
jgi:hypothetical protein